MFDSSNANLCRIRLQRNHFKIISLSSFYRGLRNVAAICRSNYNKNK